MYKSRIRNAKGRSGRNDKHRELVEPDDDQSYGVVEKLLGNGRATIYCQDGTSRIGRIRGSMRKYKSKVIIETGDLVIVARREYEEGKLDVIHKYTHEEQAEYLYEKRLPDKIYKILTQSNDGRPQEDHDYVVFAHGDEEIDLDEI